MWSAYSGLLTVSGVDTWAPKCSEHWQCRCLTNHLNTTEDHRKLRERTGLVLRDPEISTLCFLDNKWYFNPTSPTVHICPFFLHSTAQQCKHHPKGSWYHLTIGSRTFHFPFALVTWPCYAHALLEDWPEQTAFCPCIFAFFWYLLWASAWYSYVVSLTAVGRGGMVSFSLEETKTWVKNLSFVWYHTNQWGHGVQTQDSGFDLKVCTHLSVSTVHLRKKFFGRTGVWTQGFVLTNQPFLLFELHLQPKKIFGDTGVWTQWDS
jgi:hypothetical protein